MIQSLYNVFFKLNIQKITYNILIVFYVIFKMNIQKITFKFEAI